MQYLLAIALILASPDPDPYRFRVMPDVVVSLDGRLVAGMADVPDGADAVVDTHDFRICGRLVLRGPAYRVVATTPQRADNASSPKD